MASERFERGELLGEGATSQVWRARDRETGGQVALKQARDPAGALALQHEYWALARLAQPAFPKALACGADWFAMELVEGAPLPPAPWPVERLKAVMVPLALAVGHLHARGLVHGDLKPENLRFDAEGRLRVLDLGFLQQAGRPGRQRGTPLYMAPEVIRREPADPRSDVYALGAMAYEWLAGKPPFGAPGVLALLELHLRQTPPPLGPEVPPGLAEAVLACLAKDPGDRPPTPAHLLARLGWGEAEAAYLVFGSQLYGRTAEVARMLERVEAQRAGEAPALVLAGPAGIGKTRLLAQAVALAGSSALRVTAPGDTSYALVRELTREADTLLSERGGAREGAAWQALAALEPAWGEALPALEPRAQEGRLRQALALVLAGLAAAGGLLVAIDDWEAADAASRALLLPLLARRQGDGLAWVLAGDFVQEQTTESCAPTSGGSGDAFDGLEALALAPLGDDAVAKLAISALAGPAREEVVAFVLERAEGNPLRVRELLAHQLVTGALARVHGEWRLDLSRATLPELLAHGARETLATLSAPARELAGMAAVLGPACDLVLLSRLTPDLPLFEALAELEAAGLVERDEQRVRFSGAAHEAALEGLADPARWHRAAARLYEDDPDTGALTQRARHLLAAKDPQAVDVALAAARANLALNQLDTARGLLAAARELGAASEETLRLEADLARMQGDMARARALYVQAIALARAEHLEAALCRELASAGRAALVVNDASAARTLLDEALTLARKQGEPAQEARCLMTLGRLDFFAGDTAHALALYDEALAIAEAAGERALQADALGFSGLMRSPADPRGQAALTASLALHRELGNPSGVIEACINMGDRRLAAGQPARARALFEEALATCRLIGSYHEEPFPLLNLAQALLDLGQPAAAEAPAKRAAELAGTLGQDYPAGYGHLLWAQACFDRGQFAEAREQLATARGLAERAQNAYLQGALLLAEARMQLESGEREAARETASKALAAHRELGDAVGVARAHALIGRALTALGDIDAARRELDEALAVATREEARLVATTARLGLAALEPDPARALALATQARAEAAEAEARTLVAEAYVNAGEAALRLGRIDEARASFEAAVAQAVDTSLLAALAWLGVGRAGGGVEARARGEKRLRALARAAGSSWLASEAERLAATESGPVGGLPEAVAMLADLGASAELKELLERLLARLLGATRASAGALLAYYELQLDTFALDGIAETAIYDDPMLDRAYWDGRPVFEAERWALPLAEGGEVLGVLLLVAPDPARQEVVRQLAQVAAFLLGRQRQMRDLTVRVERLAFSEALARLAAPWRAPEEIVRGGLTGLLERIAADRAIALLLDDSGDLLPVLAIDRQGHDLGTSVAFSKSVVSWVASSGEALRLVDATQAEAWQQQQSIVSLGLRTILACPVRHGGQIVGVLYADSASVLGELGAREQRLLETAADVLAPWL